MSTLLKDYELAARRDLSSATCLPFGAYSAPEIHELESARLFGAEWVLACPAAFLESPSSYYTVNIAGEAVVVLRDSAGTLRAMSNNCRHRGTPLLAGSG